MVDEDNLNSGDEEEEENAEDKDKEVDESKVMPDNDYFKGLFDFALFGYIPPAGGEKYRVP